VVQLIARFRECMETPSQAFLENLSKNGLFFLLSPVMILVFSSGGSGFHFVQEQIRFFGKMVTLLL